MAELKPAAFADLVARLYAEPAAQDAVFGLPRKKWFAPAPGEPDYSVRFHGLAAGTPAGAASGPQTQMAQNLLLSYASGARILELKTVQVNDRLTIGRPCIDATTIGYNIEWSQELLVEQSLGEYTAGAMLIEIFRHDPDLGGVVPPTSPASAVIHDISLGYDLEGIQTEKVQRYLDGMRDATALIEKLRGEIPSEFKLARDLDYPRQLSRSVTLSTFHGCPANEIERICEFLLLQRDLDVIVKMNPPMLGRERLEHLLHEELGYAELRVPDHAYTTGLQFGEAVQLVGRLDRLAKSRGRSFGCKFSNTLEVANHRKFFPAGNEVQYLSGQPLHVITMTLTDIFRLAIDPGVHISFSAGIDRQNFAQAVACGFVPVSVCTDLLRPGGYARMHGYMQALRDAMRTIGAANVEQFITKLAGCADVREAARRNTTTFAEKARQDPRYRAAKNAKAPNRVDSQLVTFDCLTCDKCIPVCPNAANFIYPAPRTDFECVDFIIDPSGGAQPAPGRKFQITKEHQIAVYVDFCNECGNCDTFCPEYGGPFIRKPGFYSSLQSYAESSPRDGFAVDADAAEPRIVGRMKGMEYSLTYRPGEQQYAFADDAVELVVNAASHAVISADLVKPLAAPHRVDFWNYHTMRHLLHGILDTSVVNQINARRTVATTPI